MQQTPAEEVYRRFIDWFSKSWFGLPESEHLLPSVAALYTPGEAELLTGLPPASQELSELSQAKGIAESELALRLDRLARKGLVFRTQKDGVVKYRPNDAFFVFMRGAFWAGRPYGPSAVSAEPINRYFYDGFMDQFAHAHLKGLRTLPIQKTIKDPRRIMPYDEAAALIDTLDCFTVSICPCRQRKNLDPNSEVCDLPLEVCLHFGTLGRYIVQNELGREISKEETLDILTMAADAGLVHAMSNWQQGPDTICNCCKCCCLFFEAYHILGHHRSHDPSNFQVQVEETTCKACGLCEERCPMDAIRLADSDKAQNKKGQAPVADTKLCLGCGVCVHKCPTGSLSLARRPDDTEPPAGARDWMKHFMDDRASGPKCRPDRQAD